MSELRTHEKSLTSARGYVDYILKEKGILLPPVPETCLITYSDAFLQEATRRFNHRVIDIGSRKPTEIYFFRPEEGTGFGIVNPQYGDAMAVTTLEELIALGEIAAETQGTLGFVNFLSMGTAGHPTDKKNPVMGVGEALLVSGAASYEGSFDHYARKGYTPQADRHILSVLRDILKERGVQYSEGLVATTSAIYRETPSFITEVLDLLALGLDMETSALMTVADFYDRRLGTLLYISDVVKVGSSGDWSVEFLSGDVSETEQALFEVALEAINKLDNGAR